MHLADVPAATEHLQTAVQVCHEAARGANPDANFTQLAKAALVVPCAAQGVLHAAQQHLGGGAGTSGASAWASAQMEAAPAFLGLLVAVVTLQPALLEKVTWRGFAILCCDAGCKPAARAGKASLAQPSAQRQQSALLPTCDTIFELACCCLRL